MNELYVNTKILREIFPVELPDGGGDDYCAIAAVTDKENEYYLNRELRTSKSKKIGMYIERIALILTAIYVAEHIRNKSYVTIIADKQSFTFGLMDNLGTDMVILMVNEKIQGVVLKDECHAAEDYILSTIGKEVLTAKDVNVDFSGEAFSFLVEKNMYDVLMDDRVYVKGNKFVVQCADNLSENDEEALAGGYSASNENDA